MASTSFFNPSRSLVRRSFSARSSDTVDCRLLHQSQRLLLDLISLSQVQLSPGTSVGTMRASRLISLTLLGRSLRARLHAEWHVNEIDFQDRQSSTDV